MAKRKAAAKEGMADKTLAQAITSTGVAEVVRASITGNTVKALYRVHDKQGWLSILEFILPRAEGWSAHVCQQYFMRGHKLIYGWNFILQTTADIDEVTRNVASLIMQAARVANKPVGSGRLDSFPLVGASRSRTEKSVFDPRLPGPGRGGPSHKGAYSVTEGG